MNSYPTQSSPENTPQREFDLPRAVARLRARVEELEPLVKDFETRLRVLCRPGPCEKAQAEAGGQPKEVVAPVALHINESTDRLETAIHHLVLLKTLLEV